MGIGNREFDELIEILGQISNPKPILALAKAQLDLTEAQERKCYGVIREAAIASAVSGIYDYSRLLKQIKGLVERTDLKDIEAGGEYLLTLDCLGKDLQDTLSTLGGPSILAEHFDLETPPDHDEIEDLLKDFLDDVAIGLNEQDTNPLRFFFDKSDAGYCLYVQFKDSDLDFIRSGGEQLHAKKDEEDLDPVRLLEHADALEIMDPELAGWLESTSEIFSKVDHVVMALNEKGRQDLARRFYTLATMVGFEPAAPTQNPLIQNQDVTHVDHLGEIEYAKFIHCVGGKWILAREKEEGLFVTPVKEEYAKANGTRWAIGPLHKLSADPAARVFKSYEEALAEVPNFYFQATKG